MVKSHKKWKKPFRHLIQMVSRYSKLVHIVSTTTFLFLFFLKFSYFLAKSQKKRQNFQNLEPSSNFPILVSIHYQMMTCGHAMPHHLRVVGLSHQICHLLGEIDYNPPCSSAFAHIPPSSSTWLICPLVDLPLLSSAPFARLRIN
jgi:hypothetical protein